MQHISPLSGARSADIQSYRPPIEIHEMEGLTIVSARLIVTEEGKDALILNGDDGTSVVVALRQEEGKDAFLEVSGENTLAADNDHEEEKNEHARAADDDENVPEPRIMDPAVLCLWPDA